MKVKEIKTVESLVEDVLIDCRAARNSDNVLCFKVYQKLLEERGMDITKVSAAMLFLNMKNYGLPTTETIRRCRQKVQASNEWLRSDRNIAKQREENEKTFRDYARE